MVSWFEDPKQLIRSDKVTEFWPSETLAPEQRINAASRFIIYATCVLYLINRDVRMFIIGGTALGVLYVMERSGMIKDHIPRPEQEQIGMTGGCQQPSKENPMGNYLISDFIDRPDRPSACEYSTVKNRCNNYVTDGISYGPARSRSSLPEYQRNALSRQFITMPVTSTDCGSHYEFIHGSRKDTCRQDPRLCDPNARGVQLEAFAGLAPNGDARITASRSV